MDGTSRDRRDGSFVRPAGTAQVARDFPDVVIGVILGSFRISYGGASPSSPVRLAPSTPPGAAYVLRLDDFQICQRAAVLFSPDKDGGGRASSFLSESVLDLRSRILAHLRVEFAGRGA